MGLAYAINTDPSVTWWASCMGMHIHLFWMMHSLLVVRHIALLCFPQKIKIPKLNKNITGGSILMNSHPSLIPCTTTRWASANQFFHLNFAEFASSVLMSNVAAKNADNLPPLNPYLSYTPTATAAGPLPFVTAGASVSESVKPRLLATSSASKSVNWVTLGYTTPVKNQASALLLPDFKYMPSPAIMNVHLDAWYLFVFKVCRDLNMSFDWWENGTRCACISFQPIHNVIMSESLWLCNEAMNTWTLKQWSNEHSVENISFWVLRYIYANSSQASCGSCWAHTAAAAIESAWVWNKTKI